MVKKKEEPKEEVVEEVEPKIARLPEESLGRADLNRLRYKINELIDAK